MKRGLLITAIIIPAILGTASKGICQSREKIRDYCPESGEVPGWSAEYEPRIAKGDDLFLLINGGADIYLEYGFSDAVFHSYKLENGSSVNLEIYRMRSTESAYGMYTFKTGYSGKPIDVGHDGWMEEYYLNFWKGNLLVTLIGLDTEKETLNGVVQLARSIDAKISSPVKRPDIIDILPKTGLKPNGVTYLKGNLALFNQYLFDSRNIFGFNEGVRGNYENYNLFLLFYKDPQASLQWFKSAKEELKGNGLFHDINEEERTLFMKDQDDQRIVIKPFNHSIIIVIGSADIDIEHIFDLIKNQFAQ